MSKNFKDIRFKVKNSNSFIPQIWRIFILDILYDFLTKNKIVGSRSPIIVKYHQYFKTVIHSTKTIYMLKVSTFLYIIIHRYQNIFQLLGKKRKIENKLYFMHCKIYVNDPQFTGIYWKILYPSLNLLIFTRFPYQFHANLLWIFCNLEFTLHTNTLNSRKS